MTFQEVLDHPRNTLHGTVPIVLAHDDVEEAQHLASIAHILPGQVRKVWVEIFLLPYPMSRYLVIDASDLQEIFKGLVMCRVVSKNTIFHFKIMLDSDLQNKIQRCKTYKKLKLVAQW